MDFEWLAKRAKWYGILLPVVLFLTSACATWGELVYFAFGHTAAAGVVDATEVRHRGRFGDEKEPVLLIHYAFTEADGTRRTGVDEVPADFPIPPERKVTVDYTAGPDGASRISRGARWNGPILFTICLIVVGVWGYQLYREASQAVTRLESARR
jgi:hypothetical protein